jgi:hypothetical protein
VGGQHQFERGVEPDQVLWPSDARTSRDGASVHRAALRAHDDRVVTPWNAMAAGPYVQKWPATPFAALARPVVRQPVQRKRLFTSAAHRQSNDTHELHETAAERRIARN